jgi:hypothetical protein
MFVFLCFIYNQDLEFIVVVVVVVVIIIIIIIIIIIRYFICINFFASMYVTFCTARYYFCSSVSNPKNFATSANFWYILLPP